MRLDFPMGFATAVDTSVADFPVSPPSRGLYVGGAGNVTVVMADGNQQVTLTGLAVGVVHMIKVSKVVKTGTTATSIVALR